MPIDRAATLKTAEKLLRQGKLDLAIAEYVRIVEEDPRDWNSGNLLGDLYARAGKVDRAVDQFVRIADGLSDEGFLSKAAALYKKILKVKPDHEHALLQGAEIAGSQGLLADARTYLNTVLERRRSRSDARGAAQITIRLGSLDPDDLNARSEAARARIQIKDIQGALRDFKELAVELSEKGRLSEAVEALREGGEIDAQDPEIRERLIDVYLGAGDFARARECAATAGQLKALATRLDAMEQPEESFESLREAARLDPSDGELRTHLARTFIARGDVAAAAEYLTVESAAGDPALLLAVAELQLRGGKVDDAIALVRRLLSDDSGRRQDVAMLGLAVADHAPDAGYQVVELAAEAAVAESDWPSAAAALQEFVTRVPSHVPALLRLVDICVDGGLEATMYSAQAHLADAYITAGSASEARFIAEDLVAREPWERANVERFRRALVLMGEPDPDAIIAERLSGESPFMSTDLFMSEQVQEPAAVPTPRAGAPSHFDLGPNSMDLRTILGEAGQVAPAVRVRPESIEVDLSLGLDDIKESPSERHAQPQPPGDLDSVFARLRDDSSRTSGFDAAEKEYERGRRLQEAGQIDECIAAFEKASRAPRLRFVTASALGRLYRERGKALQAIEWFERAAQAPPPSPAEGQELLYGLADMLESAGEGARALAIFMELRAEAANYRDVSIRVSRLSKAQARG